MRRANRRVSQGVGKIQNIPQYNIDVQPVYSDRQSGNPCTTECRSRRYTNGVAGPWSGTYPAGKDCSDCCGGAARQGGSRLPQNAQRVCQVGSFNTANELASRQSKNMRSNYHDPNDRPMNNLPDNYRNLPECVRCRTTRDTLDGNNQSHGFGSWRLGAPGNCGACCGGAYASPGPRQCYPGIQGGIPIDKQANKIPNMKRNNRRNLPGRGVGRSFAGQRNPYGNTRIDRPTEFGMNTGIQACTPNKQRHRVMGQRGEWVDLGVVGRGRAALGGGKRPGSGPCHTCIRIHSSSGCHIPGTERPASPLGGCKPC